MFQNSCTKLRLNVYDSATLSLLHKGQGSSGGYIIYGNVQKWCWLMLLVSASDLYISSICPKSACILRIFLNGLSDTYKLVVQQYNTNTSKQFISKQYSILSV